MKRFTAFILTVVVAINSIAQIPFSFIKNKPVDINAFFTAVGDLPSGVQTAYTTWWNAYKTAGVANACAFAFTFPPSLTNSKGTIDFITATTLGQYADATSTAPFNTRGSTCAPMKGLIFDSSIGTSYFKTNVIPSQKFNLYDHAFFETTIAALPAATTNFDWGCFNSANQALTVNDWYSGNAQRSQNYNNTAGQGLYSATSVTSGPAGVYWTNATSTAFTLGYNSTQRVNSATQGGTLPTIQLYLGTANNNGTAGVISSQIVSSFVGFKRGLTATERAAVVSADSTLAYGLKRKGWTQKLVIDGNSHTVYWNEKTNRVAQYNLWSKTNATEVVSFGVSGQTTTQMLSDIATQIAGAYNGAYSKNVLIVYEITNEMFVGNKTVKVALDSMKSYVTKAKSYGYKVYVKKSFLRNPSGTRYNTNTTANLGVDSVNSALDTNYVGATGILPVDATHYIKRSDYPSDAAYNTACTALLTNSSYFYDGVHLTEAGYKTESDLDWTIIASEFTLRVVRDVGNICTNKRLSIEYEPDLKIAA
jgi:hypothetical protein